MNQHTPELLSDDAIDAVSGAMNCKTALAVADAYVAIAKVCLSVGMTVEGANFAGQARGLIQGGCT